MEFTLGMIFGGIMWSFAIYFAIRSKYEKEISEVYDRGLNDMILRVIDYIDYLNESHKGSES